MGGNSLLDIDKHKILSEESSNKYELEDPITNTSLNLLNFLRLSINI